MGRRKRKRTYANYLGEDPDHLGRHQRPGTTGARAPGDRKSGRRRTTALWCDYATDWAEIKEQWELTMTPVESEIVMDMLGTCENPTGYEVETLDPTGTVSGEDKPEAQEAVYGSCEDAEDAGEVRVQGSQGGGQGYPKAMVPSARDGDGDGVVCEQ